MSQKEAFLESEADAWFSRNHERLAARDFSRDDTVASAVVGLVAQETWGTAARPKILEIGCGEARRLAWLAQTLGAEVFGVEPSAKAVEAACSRSVNAQRGTADELPFASGMFDVVIFGFCLSLCDRQDLFRIAQEADRVLKPESWLVIQDFHATSPLQREYHHRHGLKTFKMDYRTLFDWHPDYVCYSHRVVHHGTDAFTDDPQEWVATSVLRKRSISA